MTIYGVISGFTTHVACVGIPLINLGEGMYATLMLRLRSSNCMLLVISGSLVDYYWQAQKRRDSLCLSMLFISYFLDKLLYLIQCFIYIIRVFDIFKMKAGSFISQSIENVEEGLLL